MKNEKKHHLEIKLKIPEAGKACFQAIEIENKSYSTARSEVKVSYENEVLNIKIKAQDLSALRAAMNTYLRWIITCQELLS